MNIKDQIGRQDIVHKICYLIDNLPQDDNFCLSLNGAWGSGKSVVLRLLQEHLLETDENIVVYYDAWKNNFYSDPLIAMLYSIADTLEKTFIDNKDKRAKKTASKLIKNVAESVLEEAAGSKGYVGFIAKSILKIRDIIKEYKKTAFTNDSTYNEYKSYASFLNNTIEQLNEITAQKIFKGKQIRFVVLVDEIDRCLPNEQLIILERMHHLFEIKNCAVVVALNKEAIKNNFEKNYGSNSDAYRRKFFQYNFNIDANVTVLMRNRLTDLFDEINNERKEPILERVVEFVRNDIIEVLSDLLINVKGSESSPISNRDMDIFFNNAKRIMGKIVDCHPAIIWFALRLALYSLLRSGVYKSIVEYRYNPQESYILSLDSYFGIKGVDCDKLYWDYNVNGNSGKIKYSNYAVKYFNDILYLFNVCKYRNDESKLNLYIELTKDYRLKREDFDLKSIIPQIDIVVSEIEHYGDR